MSTNTKETRYKMSVFAFLLFSVAGGGFILKGVINQFTQWGNNTFLLYLIATIIYAIPYVFMMLEFMSIKSIEKGESGYQTWLNAVIGKKYGFFGAFFYFFVNLFFFVDLIPNIMSYFMYTIVSTTAAKDILDSSWFKPIIGIVGIIVFWFTTYISAKGPRWMGRIASISGFSGFILTVVFIVGALVAVGVGPAKIDSQTAEFAIFEKFDISWAKIGSISWALQSLGGLEALAAYKNNIRGGQKGFKIAIWLNILLFSTIVLICSILAQLVLPTSVASNAGLLETIYLSFKVLHFPVWWTNIIALFLLITTFGGSLMIWTSAPVKILFVDAPKGIFGKKLSRVTKEKTPVNALIAQAIIVTVLLTLNTIAQFSSTMNTLLLAIRNLDGGAATIPVLFTAFAYIKMRLGRRDPRFKRSFYWLGKKPFFAILAITPLVSIYIVATIAALIPDPWTFSDDLMANILQLVMGPCGIILAWVYCEIIWKRWRIKNPNDTTLFNSDNDEKEAKFQEIESRHKNT